jgi:transcription elongation factor Elf1
MEYGSVSKAKMKVKRYLKKYKKIWKCDFCDFFL